MPGLKKNPTWLWKANHENEEACNVPSLTGSTGVTGGGTITSSWPPSRSSPDPWSCWLKQVYQLNWVGGVWQCWLSECADGESSETQVRELSYNCVPLRSNPKQTAVPSTNIYTVPGTENAIKNETYEVPHFMEIPFHGGHKRGRGGAFVLRSEH